MVGQTSFYLILVFMVAGALVAVETRDLLSSVICLGAVGFGVTLLFLILQAPDLAITQIVVEILSLVLMVAAIRRTTRKDVTTPRFGPNEVIGLACVAILLALSFFGFRQLPAFGDPLMRVSRSYLAGGLKETGAANTVAAIILDYRGYDTLGEATVLFTAAVGVVTVLRRRGRKAKCKE